LFFMCRTGGRSRAAAEFAAANGYPNVANVVGGFEGVPDAAGHRGTVAGWKADGLPWRQK
ncbi:MAG: rhodanese-like domain-containing protein, partial [Acetobacteraceae bacterium]